MSGQALLPFGYGLSYSHFVYRNIEIPDLIKIDQLKENGVDIKVEVYNDSAIEGEDVVQVYIKDHQSSIVSRVLELNGFKKVKVAPYQSQEVIIHLSYETFAVWNYEMKHEVEAGTMSICVGEDSTCYQEFKVTLA